jgi:hypothetical protein
MKSFEEYWAEVSDEVLSKEWSKYKRNADKNNRVLNTYVTIFKNLLIYNHHSRCHGPIFQTQNVKNTGKFSIQNGISLVIYQLKYYLK